MADFDRPKRRIQDDDVTYRRVTAQERRGRLLTKGDLILEKSGGGEKSPVGFVVLYDRTDPAVTSNFLARVSLRPGMEPRFWTYLHSCLYKSRLTQPSIKQTSGIQNLDQHSYFNERACFPPFDEQQLIADWLDIETAKIDTLIAKQEQLIATLREDRTATITHAVTKGLDPDVEMQASGLPWVGDIPRHWQLVPIKHVVRSIGVGLVINPSTYVADSGVPFLLGRNVRDGWIDLTNVNYMSEVDSRRLEASRLKAGDVVVVRAGYPGRAAVISADLDGANCASILILRKPTLARPELVAAFFNSLLGRAQVKLAQYGAAQEQINVGDVVNFVMPLPPPSEQQEIAERISAKAAVIDALVEKANEMIDALREYRSALITDAVTGKIDVREAA
ncbi:restriction endonuclease subunit S [Mycobacterium sp. E2327]|uniref:restriction endonuclease subunit S n=1 Tax=Mycobacterium sp. E2327 TaxID=1834132 RepID=UPI0012EA9363|nr:restriction endonuclease subunit S [Mycobacterium sp. E2327]